MTDIPATFMWFVFGFTPFKGWFVGSKFCPSGAETYEEYFGILVDVENSGHTWVWDAKI